MRGDYMGTSVSEKRAVSNLYPDNGGSIFLRNVGIDLPDYTV
jgi:hypothetical protein